MAPVSVPRALLLGYHVMALRCDLLHLCLMYKVRAAMHNV